MRFIVALAAPPLLAACASTMETTSLCYRDAEAIDPRLPVGSPDPAPGTLTVADSLAAIAASIEQGIVAYNAQEGRARAAVNAAGAPGSESWVAGVEQVAILDAARERVARGIGDLDALVTRQVEGGGWASPVDRIAVEEAIARYRPVDAAQSTTLDAMTARLGS